MIEYRLEVDADGELIIVTYYPNDYYTAWSVTHVCEDDRKLYFIHL